MGADGKTPRTVQGVQRLTSATSQTNALDFMITRIISERVSTSAVVKVIAVYSGGSGASTGYVDVLPLVCDTDAENNVVQPTTLYRLPYSRIQGGIAALVIDPVPNDIGLAVFLKKDSSNVIEGAENPVQPGSFRTFDEADGYYIGGFLNQSPSVFLELDQDNNATLTAPNTVTINTKSCIINADEETRVNCQRFEVYASESASINSPSWSFNNYNGSEGGSGTFRGDINQIGSITSTGDHVAGGISLTTHVHGGVESGGSSTSGPR